MASLQQYITSFITSLNRYITSTIHHINNTSLKSMHYINHHITVDGVGQCVVADCGGIAARRLLELFGNHFRAVVTTVRSVVNYSIYAWCARRRDWGGAWFSGCGCGLFMLATNPHCWCVTSFFWKLFLLESLPDAIAFSPFLLHFLFLLTFSDATMFLCLTASEPCECFESNPYQNQHRALTSGLSEGASRAAKLDDLRLFNAKTQNQNHPKPTVLWCFLQFQSISVWAMWT